MKGLSGKALEILSDLAEAGLDQKFADGFLRDVPFNGTAYKMAMLGKSISDQIFITKLAHFLKALACIFHPRGDFGTSTELIPVRGW